MAALALGKASALTHSFATTTVDLERDADSVAPSVILARIVRSLLPMDPELRQDWRLWRELWVRALRDEETQRFAVDLYDQLQEWVSGALNRGIQAGEFTDTDVAALSTHVLALCDGYGIRLMLSDPKVTSDSALDAVWRAIAAALGIAPAFPKI
ncbi:TetR/AcrR family transcriptional regulator [Streptomyces sp. So13.3]|nr:TetR/AcrR family transcriptional regulator [Streptomyces sp. So13.3]